MNSLLKLIGLALTAALAACQTTAPSQYPAPVDPAPPTVSRPGTLPAVAAPAAVSRQQSGSIITVHLAQQRQEPALIPVEVGKGASLYALPKPVLTQGDMARVSPITAPDQKTFLMLEMNQQGIAKLRNVTEQARGHFLLLSVQGQLVSLAQIDEAIADGRLLLSTQNSAHTQAIIRLMQKR